MIYHKPNQIFFDFFPRSPSFPSPPSSASSFAFFLPLRSLSFPLSYENSSPWKGRSPHGTAANMLNCGLEISKFELQSHYYVYLCPWCNGYRRRNWTRRHEFKSWTRLIAFHIALIPLGKVWIQLFSLQLWVNSRAD